MPRYMGTVPMNQPGNLDSIVREALREKIISGAMEGGYHLSEIKISKDYNVSRTPVREALCALAADGLVEMVPHRGAFVSHIPSNTRFDQLQTYSMFLGLAAKMAAEKANMEMLMDLENSFAFAAESKSVSASTYQTSLTAAMDMMERVANSPTVSEALNMIKRRNNMAEIWGAATGTDMQKELNTQFTVLLTAFKRNKPDTAEKTMRQIGTMVVNAFSATKKQAGSAADSITAAMAQSLSKTSGQTRRAN
jgi:DNA-binding GntR family transcriptional regulator